jgi:hypothetical protein
MPCLVGAILAVLLLGLGLVLCSLRQPYVSGYQMTIAIISNSVLISPPWLMLVKRLLKRDGPGPAT